MEFSVRVNDRISALNLRKKHKTTYQINTFLRLDNNRVTGE